VWARPKKRGVRRMRSPKGGELEEGREREREGEEAA
jgi:hypothetical protein